jgi:hypothetical protein
LSDDIPKKKKECGGRKAEGDLEGEVELRLSG